MTTNASLFNSNEWPNLAVLVNKVSDGIKKQSVENIAQLADDGLK